MNTDPEVTYTELHQGSKYGLADENGNVIVPCIWEFIGSFAEGLAAVKNEEGMWGFIDKTGALVIPCQYDRVDDFSEGLAAVDACFIDKTGACALSNDSWDNVSSFHDGLALVEVWKEDEGFYFAYIDKTGAEVITRPFDLPIDDDLGVEAIVDPETGRIRFGYDFFSDVRILELDFSKQTLLRVKDVNGFLVFGGMRGGFQVKRKDWLLCRMSMACGDSSIFPARWRPHVNGMTKKSSGYLVI